MKKKCLYLYHLSFISMAYSNYQHQNANNVIEPGSPTQIIDQLAVIRHEAQRRYQEHVRQTEHQRKMEEEKERLEKEEIDQKEKEEKEEQEKEREQIKQMDIFLDELDHLFFQFPFTDQMLESIQYQLADIVPLFEEHFRMNELQERSMRTVELLNLQQESITSSAEQVRSIGGIMKEILRLSNTEIQIDLMDTSRDSEVAEQLQFQLQQEFQPMPWDNPPAMQPVDEQAALPICSIHRRAGLTMPQLQNIARMNHLSTKGHKEELCLRLANAGLVRII